MDQGAVRRFTFKKILRTFWISVYVLVVGLYALTQMLVAGQVVEGLEKSIRLSVAASENAVERSLQMIDGYLYESYYADLPNSLSKLCHTYLYDENEVERVNALGNLSRVVKSIPSWTEHVAFDMMYVNGNGKEIWIDAGSADSFQVRSALKSVIENHARDREDSGVKGYMVYEHEGKNHLLRVIKFDKCYIVVGLSEEAVLNILKSSRYSENSICFVADGEGRAVFATEPVEEQLHFSNDGNYIRHKGKTYLQTGYRSEVTDYYFGILTDRDYIRDEMAATRRVLILVLVSVTILFLASHVFVTKFIERPITEAVENMKGKGQEAQEAVHEERGVALKTPIYEFQILAESFNHLVERVGKLKIEKYESELKSQKATMQYLQLQIKPHFYANLLNIIYSLAQSRDYETIQRVSRAIVNYSRYMFRDATELVELRREMEFLECYMEIQEIRYRKRILLRLNNWEKLGNALVPPFVIQGFVENSVKYAFKTKKDCIIQVSVDLSEDGETMVIVIKDNGDGYPKELLSEAWKHKKTEEHIGLSNIYARHQLIYGGGADIQLTNEEGAVSRISLPYIDMGAGED